MSVFRTAMLVASLSLWETIRSRRFLLMLAVSLIPALAVSLVNLRLQRFGTDEESARVSAYVGVVWGVYLQVVVILVALMGGSAVIANEVADGTLTWSLVRPISRVGLFLGRAAAALAAVVIGCALGAATLNAVGSGSLVSPEMTRATFLAGVVGGVVYGSLFACLGAIVRHPIIVGLGYAFVFEALFANLPGGTPGLSILFRIRALLTTEAPGFLQAAGFVEEGMVRVTSAPMWPLWLMAVGSLTLGAIGTRWRQFGALTN